MKILSGLLACNPDTGKVWWVVKRSNATKLFTEVAQPKDNKNYPQVRVGGKLYLCHRLVWEAVHGPVPEGYEINHINGIKNDNRLANLELVTHQENMQHAKRTGLTPKSTRVERPLIGVCAMTGAGLYFKNSAVAKVHGFNNCTLVAQGKRKTDKGYYWAYA